MVENSNKLATNSYVNLFINRHEHAPTYSIITHGCQMNEHDSEKIKTLLENMGFEKSDEKLDADFIIFNTCLVRENAEMKVYGQLGALKNLKRENPDMLIAVCGCMMQTGPARDIIREKYPQVDIVFGVNNINSLPYLIDRHLSSGKLVVDIERKDDIDEDITIKSCLLYTSPSPRDS